MSGLGLRALLAASKPGECPFCGDPRAAQVSKPNLTCGDEICKAAYHVYYGRDRIRPKRTRGEMDSYNERKRAKYHAEKKARWG